MPKAQTISVLQHDFCRRATSRVLACLALVALLAMQASMVWHGLEHVAKASGTTANSTHTLNAEKAHPLSDLCLKCLEDLTHSVGLISQALHIDVSLRPVLRQGACLACGFATPVELANQRGPPVFLS